MNNVFTLVGTYEKNGQPQVFAWLMIADPRAIPLGRLVGVTIPNGERAFTVVAVVPGDQRTLEAHSVEELPAALKAAQQDAPLSRTPRQRLVRIARRGRMARRWNQGW